MDSKTVFDLRNEAKDLVGKDKLNLLDKALNIARDLYTAVPSDEWVQKAFAWVLIDLCKYCLLDKKPDQARIYFDELNLIKFRMGKDEVLESQKEFLRPKIDINYAEIQRAEELNKSGEYGEALVIFKSLLSQSRLSELYHETYGWSIYKYIRAKETDLTSIQVRTFLRDYINLKNERPSILHSLILNFALNYYKVNNDFNFYNFFLLWDPSNLRYEDLRDVNKNNKVIPSLISRVCKELANSRTEFDLEDILNKTRLNDEIIIDFFREAIFWKILNLEKEYKLSALWELFDMYNIRYSRYGKSKWHSEILGLAERFMKEDEAWRFFDFFKTWDPANFRQDDWKEIKKDNFLYKPLAIRAIKKAFENFKSKSPDQNLLWLIQAYDAALKFYPDNEWLLRDKALLHFKNRELELAIEIYKQLILKLSDRYYIWQELSTCVETNSYLKMGILSKALSLEKNEDFLGNIRLELAKIMIEENLLENALWELELYKKHREIKHWTLSTSFNVLYHKVNTINLTLKDNQGFYKKYIPLAESFVYADFPWIEVALVGKWVDEQENERFAFTDGKSVEFTIKKKRFEILKHAELGQIFKFKLYKQRFENNSHTFRAIGQNNRFMDYKYVPLIAEQTEKKQWEILTDTWGYVDYVNEAKDVVHVITSENIELFFPQIENRLEIADFILAKSYLKNLQEKPRIEITQIQKIDRQKGLSKFPTQISLVDGVNEKKELFHFVIDNKLQGIIRYIETDLRPKEGDFVKICYLLKKDKENKQKIKVLNVEITDEVNSDLSKDIEGFLLLKFKDKSYDEFEHFDSYDANGNPLKPDFGFIEDYYVPKYLLEKYNIIRSSKVKARVVFSGCKWKVIKLF